MESKKVNILLKSGIRCTGTLVKVDKINNIIILSNGLKNIHKDSSGEPYDQIDLARSDIASCTYIATDLVAEPKKVEVSINAIPESKQPIKQEQSNERDVIEKSYNKSESFFDKLDGMSNPEAKQESKKYNDKNKETFNIVDKEDKDEKIVKAPDDDWDKNKIGINRGRENRGGSNRGRGNRGRNNRGGFRGDNRGGYRGSYRGGYYMKGPIGKDGMFLPMYMNISPMNMGQMNMNIGQQYNNNYRGENQRGGYYRGNNRGRGTNYNYWQNNPRNNNTNYYTINNANVMGKGMEIGLGGKIHPDIDLNIPLQQSKQINTNISSIEQSSLSTFPIPDYSNKFNHLNPFPNSTPNAFQGINMNHQSGRGGYHRNNRGNYHNNFNYQLFNQAQVNNRSGYNNQHQYQLNNYINPNLKQIGIISNPTTSQPETFIPETIPSSMQQSLRSKFNNKHTFDSDMYDKH